MRKPLVLVAFLAVGLAVVAGLVAPSAQPRPQSRNLIVGIFDEQATLGDPTWAFDQYKLLGVEALRVNLYWGGPSGVGRKKPANALNPNDPAYDWSVYDAMVKQSADNKIKPVFSILWTPSWAGPAKNMAPRRTIDLRNFAFAAAKRYSGSFHPTPDAPALPAVRLWMAWNEPNNPVFLKPQFTKISRHKYKLASPRIYAGMCNAIMSGVHLTGLAGEKVACGATAPRGNNTGTQPRASVSPLIFLRGLKRAHARFDVYAHHPYYQHPNESPRKPPPGPRAITLGNINELLRELTAALRQQAPLDHRVRLPDESARSQLRRLLGETGHVPVAGVRDRAREPADRHDDLVPREGRGEDRERLAVRPLHGHRAP